MKGGWIDEGIDGWMLIGRIRLNAVLSAKIGFGKSEP